ncbi:MAG: GxGYxYP domain-containing protein [Anaerolineae bacterium]
MPHPFPKTRWPLFRYLCLPTLLLLILLPACASTSLTPPPARLYIFDVSDLHLDHHRHCLGATGNRHCTVDSPPPPGKSYDDLLRDYDTLIFITTLQGIVNREKPQLYLIHDRGRPETGRPGIDTFWLEKYREPDQPYGWLVGTEIVELNGLETLLQTFAPAVEGVVLWDPALPATLNVATTIAGVENLAVLRAGSDLTPLVTAHLPVKRSLVGLFQPNAPTLPGSSTPSSGSPKTDAYLWAKEQYLDTGQANAQFVAYLEDGWPATRYRQQQMTRGGVYALERDYVVQQRGFAFDLSPWPNEPPIDDPGQPPGADAAAFEAILQAAADEAGGRLIKVWGFIPWYEKYAAAPGFGGQNDPVQGEWESTWLFSRYGAYLQGGGGDVFGVAMANVSVHKFGPQPAHRRPPATPSRAALKEKGYLTSQGQVSPERTFVLFYAGDYDLAHPVYTLLGNTDVAPWLDPHRGEVPLAWGMNPALVEDIPGIMTYLYATQTGNDFFVAANSGAGYLNPDGLPDVTLLRWLERSRSFYNDYGYNVQGFLLNGNGDTMSQRRLDAFTFLTPAGILTPDFETDEPWPRLQRETPLSAMAGATLSGDPGLAAEAIHATYRRNLAEDRPPFLAFRSSFQSVSLLWDVQNRLQADDAAGRVTTEAGQVLHPNYTVVDPYTFFALLKVWLEEGR